MDVTELETQFNKMVENEKELANYYSEDLTTSLDDFINIFRELCSNITKILEVRYSEE